MDYKLDLAVQMHYGDEIGSDIARYHVDAPNSLLHLAISVHGDRLGLLSVGAFCSVS
jgi:hypothetical protein